METGKTYVLDPAAKSEFIAFCPDDNALMVKLMTKHGNSFKVKRLEWYDDVPFVEEIEMKDGTILTSSATADADYFELSEYEFHCFLEVDDAPVVDTRTIYIQINHKNAAEAVALIKATFDI